MLPAWCIIFSIVIRLLSGGVYTRAIIKGSARPNPVTWFLWGLTAMIAFVAQLHEDVGISAWATFVLGLSPLIVCAVALARQPLKPYLTRFTLSCAACALLGIVLWRITSDASLAISFSIIADIFANLPTLVKSYRDPSSEHGGAYAISVASMIIILLTITSWNFASAAFPLYMLCINILLATFATIPLKKYIHKLREMTIKTYAFVRMGSKAE